MNTGAGQNVTLQAMNTQYLMLTNTGYSDPDEKLDYTAVPAIFNTVTMSKLILLSQSEINRLLSDLGSSVRLHQPNVMLGFIPSLDGSLQWLNGMVMAQDTNVYCQLFLLQPGETPINCRPTAQSDFYTKSGDTPLVVAAPGILANDFDPDGDSIGAQAAGGLYLPQHGSVAVNSDGSFTYTPSGTAQDDVFGYYVRDGTADSPVVWVAISVTAGNAPPVARIDGLFQTLQGEALTVPAPGVLGNDSDVDGDPLSAVLVTPPGKGTLTLEASGRFVYTPDPAETGFDNFYYQAADDSEALSALTEVGIEIVANPNVLVAITDTYVALMNTPLSVPAPGLLANDTSRDSVPLTAADPPSSVILGGFATLQPDGSFTFTPSPNFFGEGSFAYLATDGTVDSNVSTTRIIVRESNAAPVAVADTYVISAGTPITVPAPGVLGNDWDSDYHPEYAAFGLPASDPQHAILVSPPGAGVATLNDDGSFTYTPGGAFAGRDSFTYKISDGWGESGPVTVRIVDESANQAPVAGSDLYQTVRNTQLVQPAPGILANDSDGDGDPLDLLPGRAPTGGIVKLNLDGSFVYSPTVGFAGVDTFTYSIADSLGITTSATVTVNVNIPYFLPLGKR
jgi:3D (Asp-Asp-Asp) domain-containing protein